MQIRRSVYYFFFFLIVGLCVVSPVLAESAELSGVVRDNGQNPLPNAEVIFKDASSGATVSTEKTDQYGNYGLQIPEGTYDITVIPPADSKMPQSTQEDVVINMSMMYDITLGSQPSSSSFLNSIPSGWVLGAAAALIILVGFALFRRKK